ncbi:MAG TPA: hypothetical protein VJY62_01345 [Bacteroidia bacterium]|nr:hypothetical protein [Bacteroidia bacterium]
MKKEICLLFLFIIPTYLYSQDTLKHKFKPDFYKYPSNADVEKSTKLSLAKIRNLSEQDIINYIGSKSKRFRQLSLRESYWFLFS